MTLPYRPCVGVVLTRADGTIFVGERINAPGAWQMPQGGIDEGEDPRAAALRELEEETGVSSDLVSVEAVTRDWVRYDLPEDLVGKVWKGRFRGQEQKWFLMRFRGEDGDVKIDAKHPEFSRWTWMPAAEVIANIVPFKRAVYEAVLGEFAHQLSSSG